MVSKQCDTQTGTERPFLRRAPPGPGLAATGKKWGRRGGRERPRRRSQKRPPAVNVPYHACVAELLAHLPSGASAGKVVTFHQFVPSEGSNQQDPPQAKQAPSGS